MPRIRDPDAFNFEVDAELAAISESDLSPELRWPWESKAEEKERLTNELLAGIARQQLSTGSTGGDAWNTIAGSMKYIPMAVGGLILLYGAKTIIMGSPTGRGLSTVRRLL